jgi:hypothetical protein
MNPLADYAPMSNNRKTPSTTRVQTARTEPDGQGDDQLAKRDQYPMPREIGGRDGPEPTRFGDWEKNGRCIDF